LNFDSKFLQKVFSRRRNPPTGNDEEEIWNWKEAKSVKNIEETSVLENKQECYKIYYTYLA
jgi:hypothetical protein